MTLGGNGRWATFLSVGPYSGLTRISSGNGGYGILRFHPESLYSLYCLPAFMVPRRPLGLFRNAL